jgi:hypothetical protein
MRKCSKNGTCCATAPKVLTEDPSWIDDKKYIAGSALFWSPVSERILDGSGYETGAQESGPNRNLGTQFVTAGRASDAVAPVSVLSNMLRDPQIAS